MKIRQFIVGSPRLVIFLCLIPVVISLIFLPRLQKDIRADAFLSDENPALVYKKKVKEEFGLSDPMVIAVMDQSPDGIFNKDTLGLIQWLTDEVSALPNINASKVISLATAKNISATNDGMEIDYFYTNATDSAEQNSAVRDAVLDFPLYVGNIVSEKGDVTLIVAEMINEDLAGDSYREFLEIVQRAPVPDHVVTHIAGEGAIIGYLGEYVDADAQQLMPFCGLVIALVLILAFRSILPALIVVTVVLCTLSITMGTMAAFGVPIYVITNALPVVLIGISVADSIHIYLHYFDLKEEQPGSDVKSLVLETLDGMWRPVTLTSLTTTGGFLGLYFAGYMPPFEYFGLFAALGVMVAWFYSLFFLPAIMVLAKSEVSQGYIQRKKTRGSKYARVLNWVGGVVLRYSRLVICFYVIVAALGLYAASHLVVDENPMRVFNPEEPLARADLAINQHLNGTNTLDIVIETRDSEALLRPDNLLKMESLQAYLDTLPYVGGSVSIVDYLKQMNRSVNEGALEEYKLPATQEAVAQYFLIYSATSDPTDFEEEVDYDYKTANIRVNIKSGDYQHVKVIVEALDEYISEQFNDEQMTATLSGRVNIHYRWISDLAKGHFVGLAMAVALVFLASAVLMRSVAGGAFALLPVACSVLLVYAVMGATGINLGMGTSMFAAVAVGLGVDYSIHTLERMSVLYNNTGQNMEEAFKLFYPTTGKALLFNFLAIAGGFGVLTVSKISSLNIFGAIVVLAVSCSFIASITLLPALLNMFVPGFFSRPSGKSKSIAGPASIASIMALCVFASTLVYAPSGVAEDQGLSADEMFEDAPAQTNTLSVDEMTEEAPPASQKAAPVSSADEVIDRVNAVPDGAFVSRRIQMSMTDRRGKQRSRATVSFRKNYDDQKRTVLYFLEPANVRDTGFLIWDYGDVEKDDDQWLYVPALRKVRRISASDRGDYFLGTDFTYEDMKLDGKLDPRDYNFTLLGMEEFNGIKSYAVEGRPKDDEIAKELGYSRTVSWVDPGNWMIVGAKFWDLKGQDLKVLTVPDIRKTGGIWTRHKLQLENLQTKHKTEFVISDVDYASEVTDDMFTKSALERGR